MLPQSSIDIQNQILSAVFGINGTPLSLKYRSDRVSGCQAAYTLDIPVSGSHIAADLKRIELEIKVAGQKLKQIFSPQANQTYTFTWDGKDAAGKFVSGKHPVKLRTTYIYPESKYNRSKEATTSLGTWNAIAQGLGGWTINVHHAYDVAGKTLYLGNGQRRNIEANKNQTDEIAIPSEEGSQLYIFDRNGRHLRTISTLTRSVIYTFEYDATGWISAIADGDNNTTQLERNAEGTPITIIAPYGQKTQLNFNSNGYLTSVINPAYARSTFNYTRDGLLTDLTDPKGNIYQFEYDELGHLKSRQEPDGSFELLERTQTEKGFIVAKITATGRESTYLTERLSTGEERQVNKGCGGTGAIEALTDKNGKETITYPDGSIYIQEQQADPRFGKSVPMLKRTILKTPSGLEAKMEVERSISLTNPNDPLSLATLTDTVTFNDRTSTTTFDAENKQVIYTSPEGRQSILHLDDRGRAIKTEVAGLEPVTFSYSDRGQLIKAMQGDRIILSYSYDGRGQLSNLANAEGNKVQYIYDKIGRIIQTVLPSGRTYKFAYDANSNLTQIIVPSGAVHTLNYNAVNMEAGYVPPAIDLTPLPCEGMGEKDGSDSGSPRLAGEGLGERSNDSYSSTYDSEQQLTNSTLPSGRKIQGIYNQSGDLEKATYPEATVDVTYEKESKRVTKLVRTPAEGGTPQEMTFTYDGGLVTEMAWSGVTNGTYRYRYDNNFSLVGMQLDDEPEIEMKRDADGLLTQYGQFQVVRNLATGAPTQMTDGKMNIDIEYDNSGRIISRTNQVNGTIIYQLQLSYDPLSRIVQKRETVTGITHTYNYTYDLDGQLILVKRDSEIVERYVYDDNGNRTEWQLGTQQHTASYDAQDRLIELDGTPYEFDADGFLMQRGDMTLKYSATGELLEVSWPDGKAINYTYDSMNRRVARTDEKGTEQYLYGNPNHPFQITAVRDNSGNLSVYEYDDFGSLFALKRDASLYYVTTDQLGTPRVVCDVDGEAVKVLDYNSFGQQIGDSSPVFDLSISFAGGLLEVDTELVRFGFRDYDTVVGKWTAKDPISFAGEDGNLYRYVGNSSVNYTDSSGLNPFIDFVNGGADLLDGKTGPWCGIGKSRDAYQFMLDTGKCPAPVSEQDRACILHDLALKSNGVKFWQLWNPKVSEIHLDLAANSPYIGYKLLFGLMSLPGLPARIINGVYQELQTSIP
jgi:RHS repeat-associated protein